MWLTPRLSRLTDQYPDLQLQVDASANLVDLDSAEYDFVVRYATHKDSATRRCRLFAQEFIPVAAPSLAKQLRTPSDLNDVRLLHEDDGSRWRRWLDHAGQISEKQYSVDASIGLFFSQGTLAMLAASQGLGVALAEPAFATGAFSRGELCSLFDFAPWPTGNSYHVVWLRSRALARNTRTVIDWMQNSARNALDF